jgi:lipopolysaccharide/colanic/teichoic acid biosynthesis glycosyltransferase
MEIAGNLLNPFSRAVKWGMDLVLILLWAPVWIPLLALITAGMAIAERQTPFYLQERRGRHGRSFRLIKFRTMVTDADVVLERLLDRDPALREEWRLTRKLQQDPRVTRWGRVLRRWSLDELPQLLNVLRGQMSLVGPRPLPAYHHADLSPRTVRLREMVRPGITGLWQVSGRSESGEAGIERWDTYYVRNWSVWLDLVVLVRTVGAVFSGRGAY